MSTDWTLITGTESPQLYFCNSKGQLTYDKSHGGVETRACQYNCNCVDLDPQPKPPMYTPAPPRLNPKPCPRPYWGFLPLCGEVEGPGTVGGQNRAVAETLTQTI